MQPTRTLWVALAVFLGACSNNSGETILNDYEARLSRTLNLSFPPIELPEAPRKPRAEALQLKLKNSDIGTLDFLALTGCELQITIGKRNSSLGKFAAPSQRLLLDLEFLRHAPACISHLKSSGDQHDLVSLLEQSQVLKQQQLAQLIHNATLAGPEWHQFWKPQKIPNGYPNDTTSDQVLQALDAITWMTKNWLRGDYTADNQRFEAHLNTLRSGDGGVILTALQLSQQFFTRWNTTIGKHNPEQACLSMNQKTILETVIAKYFAGGVQQWLAPVISRADSIQQASNNLETLLGKASPPEYDRWQQQRNDYIQTMKSLTIDHVHRLKRVDEPCQTQ